MIREGARELPLHPAGDLWYAGVIGLNGRSGPTREHGEEWWT